MFASLDVFALALLDLIDDAFTLGYGSVISSLE